MNGAIGFLILVMAAVTASALFVAGFASRGWLAEFLGKQLHTGLVIRRYEYPSRGYPGFVEFWSDRITARRFRRYGRLHRLKEQGLDPKYHLTVSRFFDFGMVLAEIEETAAEIQHPYQLKEKFYK